MSVRNRLSLRFAGVLWWLASYLDPPPPPDCRPKRIEVPPVRLRSLMRDICCLVEFDEMFLESTTTEVLEVLENAIGVELSCREQEFTNVELDLAEGTW